MRHRYGQRRGARRTRLCNQRKVVSGDGWVHHAGARARDSSLQNWVNDGAVVRNGKCQCKISSISRISPRPSYATSTLPLPKPATPPQTRPNSSYTASHAKRYTNPPGPGPAGSVVNTSGNAGAQPVRRRGRGRGARARGWRGARARARGRAARRRARWGRRGRERARVEGWAAGCRRRGWPGRRRRRGCASGASRYARPVGHGTQELNVKACSSFRIRTRISRRRSTTSVTLSSVGAGGVVESGGGLFVDGDSPPFARSLP